LSNSYDFFMRGEEILSGAQRIHKPNLLKMHIKGLEPSSMQGYVDAFRLDCPPHAGEGIGVSGMCDHAIPEVEQLRRVSLFPRDPKRLVLSKGRCSDAALRSANVS
ncbi:hypothetical protein JB92DRAFT_2707904, partial [Gautieria morchelliformis]